MKEAAARLRVSPAMVYRLCERGELRYLRIPTHAIRLAGPEVSAFVDRRRAASADPVGAWATGRLLAAGGGWRADR